GRTNLARRGPGAKFGSAFAAGRWLAGSFLERTVVAAVVVPVFARFQRTPPLLICLVPPNRAFETFAEGHLRLPAELGDPRDVERVPVVMAEPIRDELDEASRLARDFEHCLGHTQAVGLETGADVVSASDRGFVQHQVDRAAVVF